MYLKTNKRDKVISLTPWSSASCVVLFNWSLISLVEDSLSNSPTSLADSPAFIAACKTTAVQTVAHISPVIQFHSIHFKGRSEEMGPTSERDSGVVMSLS